MTDEPWVLAIDFGTSYSVAAARTGAAAAEVIEIDGERRTPSVVLLDESGQLIAGRAAEDLSSGQAGRVLRTPKSRLGDPAPVVLGGKPQPIGNVVAALLRHIYAEAVRWAGRSPVEVRLTHPATWGGPRRQQLLDAAKLAGLPDPTLVPEPVAAAIAYADVGAIPEGGHVLVYDLGGGTFDTAALESSKHGFVLIGRPTGDVRLGGELFDELLANHLGEQLDPEVWEKLQLAEDAMWLQAANGVRREARRVKESLSAVTTAEAVLALPTGLTQLRVERSDLDALIRPYLEESVDLLVQTAHAAGLQHRDISAVYLVGGASRTPLVEQLVAEAFPDVARSRRGDPKAVVAIGATHPLATPTRLAQRTSIDQEAPTIEHSPVPLVTPPTVIESPGTLIDSQVAAPTVTVPASPTPPAPAHDSRKRLALIGGSVAAVVVLGVAGALAFGGDDGGTATPVETTITTIDNNLGGRGPVGLESLPITRETVIEGSPGSTPNPADSSTTTAAPIITEPPPPPPQATQADVDAALLTAADLGADWTQAPYEPTPSACGDSPTPTVVETYVSYVRDEDSLEFNSIVHAVGSYESAAVAAAEYQTVNQQLAACNGAVEKVSGFDYTITVVSLRELPVDQKPAGCDGLAALLRYDNQQSPVPELFTLGTVARCGANYSTVSWAAARADAFTDTALQETVAKATSNLLGLPGSLVT